MKIVMSISCYAAAVFEAEVNEKGEITCTQVAPGKMESAVAAFGVGVKAETPEEKAQYERVGNLAIVKLLRKSLEKVEGGDMVREPMWTNQKPN